MELPVLVGERIRNLRKAKGWTQEQLAEAATLHYSYIGGVERGDRNISLETLEKIINALNVPPTELFRFDDNSDEIRRAALDEILTMITSRKTGEIEMISKINKEIFNALDAKSNDS
ncbi:helix-turn-helix domain-containing protein [Paenibacillus chartarius]|uniref:Helix-turn-helix domain-containing protein n=1 Tax=Paenibacillus chartarius TaxID=747481 RepID=A0ABV6DJQ2_9BACL